MTEHELRSTLRTIIIIVIYCILTVFVKNIGFYFEDIPLHFTPALFFWWVWTLSMIGFAIFYAYCLLENAIVNWFNKHQ